MHVNIQFVTRSKQSKRAVYVAEIRLLMLYCEIIALCREMCTKHDINLSGRNVKFLNVEYDDA